MVEIFVLYLEWGLRGKGDQSRLSVIELGMRLVVWVVGSRSNSRDLDLTSAYLMP